MTIPAWPIRLLRVATALVLVAVAGWYSPSITATIWHVFHPRGWVSYRGLQVWVPWPWIADTDAIGVDPTEMPQGLSLRRLSATMSLRLPPQSLFITVISPDPGVSAAQQTERWIEAFREAHPGSTFDAATPEAMPPGANCLSARNPATPAGVVWTCISVKGGWVANFEGYQRDVPVFFQVVVELQPEEPKVGRLREAETPAVSN